MRPLILENKSSSIKAHARERRALGARTVTAEVVPPVRRSQARVSGGTSGGPVLSGPLDCQRGKRLRERGRIVGPAGVPIGRVPLAQDAVAVGDQQRLCAALSQTATHTLNAGRGKSGPC